MWSELEPLLPPALASAVRPGACSEGSWVLQVSSPAVAAKLKLHLPLLQRRLQTAGWPALRIQLRVQAPVRCAPAAPQQPRVGPAPPEVRARLRALRARRGG